MAHNLSNEELAEFREIFNLVDRDGGGTITKEELGELMDTLGIDATPEEIDLMIHEIDQDNNGEIDFEEFVAVMSRKVSATYTADQVKNAFKVFEGDAPSGHIKVDVLIRALTNDGTDKLTDEQAHDPSASSSPTGRASSTTRVRQHDDERLGGIEGSSSASPRAWSCCSTTGRKTSWADKGSGSAKKRDALWYLKNIESHALMYHHRPGRKVAMVCDDNGDGVYWTGYVRNAKAPKAKAGSVARHLLPGLPGRGELRTASPSRRQLRRRAWFPPETADEGDDRPGNYAKNALLARCRKDVAFLLNVGHRLPLSSDLWKLCVSCALPLKDLGYRGWRLQVALLGDDRAFVCIDGSYPFPVHPTL
ncbi:Ca2-binding protein [Aureococcus anophagefferens]|nr:Ca2-binding protein [Aureococcus anophagefferens]